jgi:hypothetical protein
MGGSCGLGELALLAAPRTQCSFVRACSTYGGLFGKGSSKIPYKRFWKKALEKNPKKSTKTKISDVTFSSWFVFVLLSLIAFSGVSQRRERDSECTSKKETGFFFYVHYCTAVSERQAERLQ